MLSTAVPVLAIVLAVVADKASCCTPHGEAVHTHPAAGGIGFGRRVRQHPVGGNVDRRPAASAALGAVRGTTRQLQCAYADIRRQRTGPAAGRLNDMVRDLSERQRLRDLFGRYVGEDVPGGPRAGTSWRSGARRRVLFVTWSAPPAGGDATAAEVVHLLNEFFAWWWTRRQARRLRQQVPGDAALAISAPQSSTRTRRVARCRPRVSCTTSCCR